MRGALITIRCDCGGVGYAPHGATWDCGECGRSFDTRQIPADEYWAIMREMRQSRLRVIAVALTVTIAMAILIPFAGPWVLIVLPVLLSFWFLFYMPRWRRRTRERARSLQHWNLHPK
jgi:Flp pilus assembly protein TadB